MITGGEQLHPQAPAPSAAAQATSLELARERLRERELRAVGAALAQERRRIAADVHDLVMQDLALALATARMLPPQHASNATLVAAAERALAGARRMLDELGDHDRQPVVEAVRASVLAAARDVPVSFTARAVGEHAQPDPPTLDALVHIGREAVTNAVKHAAPAAIEVELERADEWRLRVSDDGRGFAVAHSHRGFGVESMRRHARALGGSLHVSSIAGLGTTVEARLP